MELTREEIYRMMWSEGVGKTEKALGLKQSELKLIYDKYNIPRPSSNYWTALAFGKETAKASLPETNETQPIRIEDYIRSTKKSRISMDKSEDISSNENKSKESKTQSEDTSIYKVPDTLDMTDRLIADTKSKLHEINFSNTHRWNEKNPFKCKAGKWLSMKVSEGQEERALRIYSTIIKAARAHGHDIDIINDKSQYHTTCTTFFIVRGHRIQTFLKETYRQTIKEDGTKDRNNLIGSGMLKFECDRYEHHYRSSYDICAAQDTKHSMLEEKIQHIIEVLEEVADYRDEQNRLRREEEEKRRIEEERKELERKEQERIKGLRDKERGKVIRLISNADRLQIANNIRIYIEQFQNAMKDKMDDNDLANEIQWMSEKADFIDPFINRKDEVLTDEDINLIISPEIIKTSENIQNSFDYGISSKKEMSYWQIKNMWHKR